MRALIVVDVQNDFAHPDGNLYVPNGSAVPLAVNKLIPNYEHIVYTKDFHPPVTEHFDKYGGPWPVHCVAGTWGAQFHEDLEHVEDSSIIHKGKGEGEDGYSGFTVDAEGYLYATPLRRILDDWNVTEVDIVGIALDVCVKATALDAVELGFPTRVILEATAPVTAEGGEEAVQEMRDNGVTII